MASSDLLDINEESVDNTPRSYRGLSILGTLVFIVIVLIVSFELVYAGKIYPGVSANGVYLGGLTKLEAEAKLAKATTAYSTEVLPVAYNNTTLRIPLNQLSLQYNAKVSEKAVAFGRTGDWQTKLHAQARSIMGKSTPYSDFTYTADKLDSYVSQIADEVDTAVQNATLSSVSYTHLTLPTT